MMRGAKTLTAKLRAAQYDFDLKRIERELVTLTKTDAPIHLAHPFETLTPAEYVTKALAPLCAAWPDLERRETIVIEGHDADGSTWLGCCGYWIGSFARPWLGILPSGHIATMRFHEFYQIVDGKISQAQILWDIPEVMLQAGLWPMVPALGREFHVPGPATQDGLTVSGSGDAACMLVERMLVNLGNFASGGVEAMKLEQSWHPKFNWYGPSGIGAGRGVSGFRNWHQIPFLNAMPDRVGNPVGGHLFAEGDYVGFTAWPGMQATLSGDGWLGLAPSNQEISLRSLDFWRVEGDLIRENWVLVDLLDVYAQLGIDVLGRMREMAKAKRLVP